MPRLKHILYIARSQESVESFRQECKDPHRMMTLSGLLERSARIEGERLDALTARYLLKHIAKGMALKHFASLSSHPRMLDTLYHHIVSMKKNRLDVVDFGYPEIKRRELEALWRAYEAEKAQLGFVDEADVLADGLLRLREDGLDGYAHIVIDRFEEEGVHFYASKLEKEAWVWLKSLPEAKEETIDEKTSAKPVASLTCTNTRVDEAVFALKAARKFIDAGETPDDVAIVCSDVNRYRRYLERYAPQLGLTLRFSSGTPMRLSPLYGLYMRYDNFENFAKAVGRRVEESAVNESVLKMLKRHFGMFQSLDKTLRIQAARIGELFGEKPEWKSLKKEGVEGRFIPPDPEESGLFVTEPNQMTKRRFSQVIFIGGDLSSFPPRIGGDMFRTARQKETLLGYTNSYLLSAYYFERMRRNSGALHVAWSQHEGRRPLYRSPVLANVATDALDVTAYRIRRDLLLGGARAVLEEEGEAYIEALTSSDATVYDGIMERHTFSRHTLSASGLETYAKCPLRYLFERRYKLVPPVMQKDEERLEASDIGTIFHEIAKRFADDVKQGIVSLGAVVEEAIKRHIEAIADDVFEAYMQEHIDKKGLKRTLFHELVLHDLKKGLYNACDAPGLLIRLLRYFHEEGTLEHLDATEHPFFLDETFALTNDEAGALIKGFIDRIDKEEKAVRVVDYKTGKYDKDKEKRLMEDMESLRAFQLPLYLLFAKAAYDAETMEAHLVSFRHKDTYKVYGNIGTVEEAEVCFDEAYENRLKTRIVEIDDAMQKGAYGMTPSERNCEYCDFIRICHAQVLPHKEVEA